MKRKSIAVQDRNGYIAPSSEVDSASQIPLCVDLDGTLVKTDLLYESFFLMLKLGALLLFKCASWLLKGKAYFKHQIAARVSIDPQRLPYHKPFLEFLKLQHSRGRPLILCTASHEKYAHQIAAYLGLFDGVIASDAQTNMGGKNKRLALVSRYGVNGFDYAGNSRADLEVWPYARNSILVNPPPAVQRAMQDARVEQIFKDAAPSWRDYCRMLRVHQWLKNGLLLVPAAAAHRLNDLDLLAHLSVAFIVFSLCASSVYILNDLLDLDLDREHPRKRGRPFAEGQISIMTGALLVPTMLLAALALALALSYEFLALLGVYCLLTLAYSLWLKSKLLVDVLLLAGLYTLRIIAGSAAVVIWPSFWLLAFSMFLFLSLALVKRYVELLAVVGPERSYLRGRSYQSGDLSVLNSLGASSGYLSVLVLALYINRDDVSMQYAYPQLLWALCPLLLYWISRVWILAARGHMHDDPLVFALRDGLSRWVAMAAGTIVWLAA
ncbi:MAG: UbiA family prenyltransferase [Gammaproteobacteria bacterium]